jgi:hypothetical protein
MVRKVNVAQGGGRRGWLWVGVVALVLAAALGWVATPPQDIVPRTHPIDPSTTVYVVDVQPPFTPDLCPMNPALRCPALNIALTAVCYSTRCRIDNGFYDTEAFAYNWWAEGGWAAPLLAMNDARVPYFDRAFHHLGTPPTPFVPSSLLRAES